MVPESNTTYAITRLERTGYSELVLHAYSRSCISVSDATTSGSGGIWSSMSTTLQGSHSCIEDSYPGRVPVLTRGTASTSMSELAPPKAEVLAFLVAQSIVVENAEYILAKGIGIRV